MCPVANVVKAVAKLLTGHRCAIVEILFATDHLAQGIVLVNPIAAVHQQILRPLIGRIVAVIERDRCRAAAAGRRGNLRQSVQIIIGLGRRHPGCAALFEGNLAHQR